jgi:hypothetical protein
MLRLHLKYGAVHNSGTIQSKVSRANKNFIQICTIFLVPK